MGIEPITSCLQGSLARPWNMRPHSRSSEVRPGVEPGLPPYHGGAPPKRLQTGAAGRRCRRLLNQVIPDGVEPPSLGCEPGVVAGHRDHAPQPGRRRRRATIGAVAAPVFTADRRGPAAVGAGLPRPYWPRRESNPQSRQALDLAALPVCVLGPFKELRRSDLNRRRAAYETALETRLQSTPQYQRCIRVSIPYLRLDRAACSAATPMHRVGCLTAAAVRRGVEPLWPR